MAVVGLGRKRGTRVGKMLCTHCQSCIWCFFSSTQVQEWSFPLKSLYQAVQLCLPSKPDPVLGSEWEEINYLFPLSKWLDSKRLLPIFFPFSPTKPTSLFLYKTPKPKTYSRYPRSLKTRLCKKIKHFSHHSVFCSVRPFSFCAYACAWAVISSHFSALKLRLEMISWLHGQV